MAEFKSNIKTIEWTQNGDSDGVSKMIDQTLIPYEYKYIEIKTGQEMFDAIKTMIVRGAPAIGISGAHGLALAAKEFENVSSKDDFFKHLKYAADFLISQRPTAVNLAWAVNKLYDVALSLKDLEIKDEESTNIIEVIYSPY